MEGKRSSTGGTRIRAALIALLALFCLGALAFAGPAAASTTDAPFDSTNFQAGDGDQDAENTFIDWQTIRNDVISQVDDGASGFSLGSKEDEPGGWVITSSEPDNKFGILNDWAYTNDVVQPGGETHKILYLAFVRDSPNGNTFLTFELNQRTDLWDADGDPATPDVPCRTDGDVAISYEVEPGGSTEPDPVTIRLYNWEEATADPDTGCSLTGTFTGGEVLNDPALANPLAQAAINENDDITNYLDTNGDDVPDSGTFAQGTFGEAAIDLTAVFNEVNRNCFSFGVINMHSRASSELNSAVKDYIDPLDIPVNNCTASGVKFEDLDADGEPREANEPGLEGWRIWADYDQDGVLDDGEPFDDTDADGNYLITDIQDPDGVYDLREKRPDGGTEGWTCSFPATEADGGDFPCAYPGIDTDETENVTGKDFGNYQNATVIVEKQTLPDGLDDSFGFTSDIPGKASFNLTDGQQNSTSVTPGTYEATESANALFDLTDVSCSGDTHEPNSTGDEATRTATFEAQSGETITCVFENTEKPGKVEIVKDADHATVNAGEDIGFTLTVTNTGTGRAHGVTVSDDLPDASGLNWTKDSGPGTCTVSGTAPQKLTCTAVELAPGASFTVHVKSPTTAASCKKLDNTGTVDSTNSGSDSDDASVTVLCPDSSLKKEADDATVSAGDPIGFTITYTNAGPGEAKGVTINDPLPSGAGINWSIESGSANCSITGAPPAETLTCTAVDVPSGGSVTAHVVSGTTGASCKAYENTASATATNHAPLEANDSTTVECPTPTITKEADKATVDAGDEIGFTITYTNAGPGTAKGVVIDDPLPGGGGVDWSIESGPQNCSITGAPPAETLHCTAVDVASGDSLTVHIVSDTTAASCKAYVNAASATATNHAPLEASDTTTVVCGAVEIDKKADHDSVDAGTDVGFTITVTNTGAGLLHGVKVTDKLPGGLDWEVDDGTAAGTCDPIAADGTLTCNIGDLATGAEATIHISAPTSTDDCGVLENKAFVTTTNDGSDDDTATIDIDCPAIKVVKSGPATVEHGQNMTFQFAVTTGDGDVPLHDVTVSDDTCPDAAFVSGDSNDDDILDLTETWIYTCTMAVPAHAEGENPIHNTVTAKGTSPNGTDVTDTDDHNTVITHPGIHVVKSGPAEAYHGDSVTFTFVVTNAGDVPLSNITVADDKCPNAALESKTGGNQDDVLDVDETWTYKCTMAIPAHQAGEADPIHNTVTATGTSPKDTDVSDTDSHDTDLLHPAIDIEKDGPATATAGDVLIYSLTVKNPGDMPFASDKVVVTDPGCDDQPTQTSVNGDATPGSLDPGDTWTYRCSHATAANVALTYPNTATVTGTDRNNRTVTDNDTIETVVNVQQQLPEEVVNGTARLRGPSGCVRNTFTATVRGSRIAQVTFFVDGKRVKRITAPNGEGSRFTFKVNPKGRGFGVHRVTAKVVFNAASQTQTRTLRLSFQRCRKQVVKPRFTG